VSPEPTRSSQTGRAGAWRVILVGRTGLDQSLRRSARIELIRARDSYDAIGELSDPIDAHSPAHTAVLVAPGAEPEGDEFGRFLDAMRLVDPSARLARVGAMRRGYDGAVDPGAAPDELVRTIESLEPTPRIVVAAPEVSETGVAAPEVDASPEPEDAIHDAVLRGPSPHAPAPSDARESEELAGEHALLMALGDGRPILGLAMARIRAHTGREDLSFSSTPEPGMVPVGARGHIFGAIACADSAWLDAKGRSVLEPCAAWLGAWLRLESQQRDLRHSAFTDELTGAWNRRYFSRFLASAIERSRAARRTVTLLFFDIDDFKRYNDEHGHDAGDEILVETVRLLNSVIRPSDRVCRIGGDEFAVIFYDPRAPRESGSAPPESIYEIATRFQAQICTHRFPKLGARAQGTLTISGGLASYPWDGADAEALLRVADELALRSKRKGKNVITLGPGAESVCRTQDRGDPE